MKLSKTLFPRIALVLALSVLCAEINAHADDASARADKSASKHAVVVYPVAMTNVGATNAPVVPAREPVVEAREFEIDTPIGQVRNVLKTLEELRAGQNRALQTLETLRQTTQGLAAVEQDVLAAVERLETKFDSDGSGAATGVEDEITPSPQETGAPRAQSRYETLWSLARAVAALAILWLLLRGVKSAIQEAREKTK